MMSYILKNKPHRHDGQCKQLGFSLVEVLISMAIGLVIIGVLTSTFVSQRQTYDVQQQITEAIQMARATMDMMQGEIRLAGYDPAEDGFDGVKYNKNKLRVRSDLNGDGDTSDQDEDITYKYYDATDEIKRDAGGGFQPFADNVQSFTFSYLDENGKKTKKSNKIRQVQISITVRTEKSDPDYPENNGYRTISLSSYITPRNLKNQ